MQTIVIQNDKKIEVLKDISYFKDLKWQILVELAAGMHLYRYEKDEIVFWEGDESAGLHIIRTGSVKLYKISPQGRQLVIKVLEEGATFNEVPVFDHRPNPVNVSVVEESELWVIDSGILRNSITKFPELAQSVIHNLCDNLRMLLGTVEELSFYQVTNRLARLINKLPADHLHGSNGGRLTQDEIAARLGTVREVVARALKELERSGAIVVNRGRIRVVNSERLAEWT
jgi:CRP/FNR family cyclic AMP-dependent transcriptional regulator